MKNENELLLCDILNKSYPGMWVNEFKGIPDRKFRFDCACPSLKIAIEIEGGLWITGRHNQPLGMMQDMEKYNLAVLNGWKVLRYTTDTVRKTPWKIIEAVRLLCGVSEDPNQTKLSLDGLKQQTIGQVQVKLCASNNLSAPLNEEEKQLRKYPI